MTGLLSRSNPVRGLLIDITGVLYDYGAPHAISGSLEAMQRLKSSAMSFKLLTNQAKDRTGMLVKYLHHYGFDMITAEDMISPVPAAVQYMRDQGLRRPFLLVHENVKPDFKDCFPCNDNDYDCLVMGDAGDEFSYKNLNHAFDILMDMDKPVLISLASSKFYKFKQQLSLDVGPFVKALEHASVMHAIVIGKPSPHYFNAAVNMMGLRNEDVVMIGDDIVSDVQAAAACGITGILVSTGKGAMRLETSKKSTLNVNFAVAKDLLEAVDAIMRHNESLAS